MSQLPLLEPMETPIAAPRHTQPYSVFPGVLLFLGDCIEAMRQMPANCVDAIGTDGPYGLGFMGKEWDSFKPGVVKQPERYEQPIESENPNLRGRRRSPAISVSQIEYDYTLTGLRRFQAFTEEWAREAIRVLKPGGYIVSCGAPRAAHRMVCGLEDAGFEICDSFPWLFGQGFPKNLDACRAIDMELCESAGRHFMRKLPPVEKREPGDHVCAETELGAAWLGWGTALKPGHEPICLAQKPFKGTLAENLLRWGVGALNIAACRIGDGSDKASGGNTGQARDPLHGRRGFSASGITNYDLGRWPANVLLDDVAAQLLDEQSGIRKSGPNPSSRGADKFRKVFGNFKGEESCTPARGADAGGASRFFFVAKPSRLERDFGCDDLPHLSAGEMTDREDGSAGLTPYAGAGRSSGGRNPHPTVKPVALMRYLLRLICPPGGVVIDPFLGSGTTGMAAVVDGYQFVGMEREEKYLVAADARIRAAFAEVHA